MVLRFILKNDDEFCRATNSRTFCRSGKTHSESTEPQKRWGSVTVATVSRELYQKIITHKPPTDRIVTKLPPPPVEPSFHEIAEALERKGQVILYGPPGTGKTYTARRFAVWWLQRHTGIDTEALPADLMAFTLAEKKLTTVQMNRRVWWLVANPAQWKLET